MSMVPGGARARAADRADPTGSVRWCRQLTNARYKMPHRQEALASSRRLGFAHRLIFRAAPARDRTPSGRAPRRTNDHPSLKLET